MTQHTDHTPPTDQQLTPAEIRLAQYGERTSTWSTATYNDGTEKALHGIALELKAEIDDLRAENAKLIRWHREDGAEMDKQRATIARLRAERDELIRQRDQIAMDTLKAIAADDESEPTGTRPCGHDDYHDPHEWADRAHVWCAGIGYDEPAASAAENGDQP